MANKKIIELDAVSQVNSDAVFPLSQLVDSNQKTLKATVAQMQAAMLAPVSGLVTLGASSGSIASFSTDIADKLFSCYVNVTAVQAGSGTPAPDNVRAISGWSACNLTGCGKNLFGGKTDGTLFATSIPKGVTLTVSMKNNSGAQFRLNLHKADQTISDYWNVAESTGFKRTFTTSEPIEYFSITNTNGTVQEVQVEYGEDKTTYQAYNGTTHNIPFNTTVYGGVLDVLSGVLTVTHGYITFDGSSDEIWSYSTDSGTGRRRVFIAINGAKPNSINLISNMLVTQGVVSGYPDEWKCSFNGNSTPSLIIGVDNSISSSSDWTAYISSHNLVIVYELATPTVIQLTPTEVKTILGQNNIFADTGDIDLKYLETIGNRL